MNITNRRSIDMALWVGQWSVAAIFEFTGMVKLGLEPRDLRPFFGFASIPTASMLHAVAAVEIATALLVVLPAILRILPWISPAAACAMGGILISGIVRPATPAGTGHVVLNEMLLLLAAFVAWGRLYCCPIRSVTENTLSPRPGRHVRERVAAGRMMRGQIHEETKGLS